MGFDVKKFLGSFPGRVATFSTALALAYGGLVTLVGHGGHAALLMAALTMLVVAGFVAAIVLSLATQPVATLWMVCTLPPVAGIYLALLHKWRSEQPTAIVIVLFAGAALSLALTAVKWDGGGGDDSQKTA